MSVKYEDLQYLESEGKSQGFTDGLPALETFLQRLLSSTRSFLLSLGLSLLLLVGICVIGSQNSKFQRDLATLRTTFSNFTSNTTAEVQALKSQGGSLQEMITSLKAEVESHKQELQAGTSGLQGLKEQKPHPGHCPHCPSVCVPGYSEMLLRVQQLVKNLNSLTCKMAALKSNGSQNNCCPTSWLEHEGSCYWFSSSGKPWPEAEKYCQQEDAYLVVINSREEQDFVQAHIGSSYTWMGLSDLDGVWKWADGTDYETNFKNWKPGQPDDWQGHGLGGGEDCAHFHPDGKWNDDACQRPYHWICEAGLSKGS
uniref:C-type lectin domain family 10 member A n=1 Tax=Tursiops truncatus TaxID=9739 RepID=A0A6J3QMQ7_TURTR|nr:C-type lectin domain family 10 member A [Tursiops truncatus]